MHWQRNRDRRRAAILGLAVLVWAGASWAQPRGTGIRVLSPSDGAVFEPGQAVTVIVEPTGSIPLQVVGVVTLGVITGSFSAPFHVSYAAPQALGRYELDITAKDAKDHLFDAELTYHVETATPVTSLQVRSSTVGRPPSVNLIAGVIEQRLRVDGVFADGATRDISKSREIQYISSNPQVATVTADGLVEAVDPGATTITVTYKGKSVTVPVTVKFKKLTVPIDIRPRGPRNIINLTGMGRLPVAILSTPDFDAALVRPGTVRFGPGRAKAVPGGEDEREEREERGGTLRPQLEDVNHDGRPDLLLHFKIRDTGLVCGDTQATLTGFTTLGQRISGTDAIQVEGPGCH